VAVQGGYSQVLIAYLTYLGIIQSHRGVIGILLSYIPHKHRSLHALLAGIEEGTTAPSEAAPSLRQKWARQIRETLAGLHGLGILWRDPKTDNVLIDNNGDAVLLDFGGGNTAGWVDNDKYATMDGEEQGLGRIMEALRMAHA
jgi:serine/threonine protein kinase